MEQTLQYFKALADETRLRLLYVLSRYEMNVNELMDILSMGQSRVSRHLKILSSAGLLSWRRDGLWVFYSAVADGDARRFMEAVLPFLVREKAFRDDLDTAANLIEERHRSTRQFFNAIADDWDQLTREVLGSFDLPGAIIKHMPDDAVAVDLGCGTGQVIERMLQQAREVIGVDGSARMLDLARRRFTADSERISLRIGDLEHLPLRDGEVDFVSINMVLHHLSSPHAALSEARRVLKESGRLVIADFDRHENEAMRVSYGDRWLGFGFDALSSALSRAGFIPVSTQRFPVEKGLFIHLILAESAAA